MEHVGKKIRQHRLLKGLSQQQLADMIHKGRPLISHIETSGQVNHDTFLKICKALDVVPEHLESASDESTSGYGFSTREEMLLLKAENERLKNEVKLKDEIIELLKSATTGKSERIKRGKK